MHIVPDCLCKHLSGTSTAGRATVVCLAVSTARALIVAVARRLLRNPSGPARCSEGLSATHIRSAVVFQVLCTGNRHFLLALKK